MNNEISVLSNTKGYSLVPDVKCSLLEMRRDPKRFPRLGAIKRPEAIDVMKKIVMKAFLYKGIQADVSNVEYIAGCLVDELQADMDGFGTRFISFAEVSWVIRAAVLSEDMFGISVSSLYKVIIDYIKTDGHMLEKKV